MEYNYKETDIVSRNLSMSNIYVGMFLQSIGNKTCIYKVVNVDIIEYIIEIIPVYTAKFTDGKLEFLNCYVITQSVIYDIKPRFCIETKLTDKLNIRKIRSKKLKELLK